MKLLQLKLFLVPATDSRAATSATERTSASSLSFASLEPDVGSTPSMGNSAILFTDRLELGTPKPFASF